MTAPATKLPRGAMRACQCAVCGNVFTSITGFEKHRKNGRCLEPLSVGLSLNDRGLWATPATENCHWRSKP